MSEGDNVTERGARESGELSDNGTVPEDRIRECLMELRGGPEDPVPFFKELEALSGVVPYRRESKGKYNLLIADWIAWGESKGLIEPEAEEPEPKGGNPLLDALERIYDKQDTLERKIDEIQATFKKLFGVLNLLVDAMQEKNRPWSDRTPKPGKREEDTGEDGESEGQPVAQPLPRVPPSPPIVRAGRVYN